MNETNQLMFIISIILIGLIIVSIIFKFNKIAIALSSSLIIPLYLMFYSNLASSVYDRGTWVKLTRVVSSEIKKGNHLKVSEAIDYIDKNNLLDDKDKRWKALIYIDEINLKVNEQ